MAGKVKVVGYAQRVFFDDGIEYRNFSDDLVGQQLVSDGGTPLFTINNFNITTNLDPKASKIFGTNGFSDFINLENLDLTCDQAVILLNNNAEIKLNLDKSNLCNYAYFGSLVEFIRVSLENIITNWSASIFVEPSDGFTDVVTVEDYVFDSLTQIATFKTSTNRLVNNYSLNFLETGSIIDTFNETNDLRNLTVNFAQYDISASTGEFAIIDFSGATSTEDDFIFFTVQGNPFSGSTGSTIAEFHIKPNTNQVELFFNGLPDFESYLLNRLIAPQYTAEFEFPRQTETGLIVNQKRRLTWPTTDGYNLDFDTAAYIGYVSDLLDIAESTDLTKSNLMVRFLTSESISDFDTVPRCDGIREETAGQKMNRTLKIYGREFDEVKRYTDGIAFANTVTYNKINNTPDQTLKNVARVLGWELTSSIADNDLLNDYLNVGNSTYSGESRGLSPAEAEIELWRRIIMNTPWLWKSKGTRKAVEFLFKFIGTPEGLVAFNEYVYVANKPLDIEFFKDVLELNTGERDIELLNIDSEGYPKTLPDTEDMYFQKGGLWYRETAGSGATVDITTGNNPHVGPYDGGQEYIDQFACLIPDFTAVTVTEQTITTGDTNIFTNYNSGFVNSSFDNNASAVCTGTTDFGGIFSGSADSCVGFSISAYTGTCSGTGVWSANITVGNTTYSGTPFYSSTTFTDLPLAGDLNSSLDSLATSAGLVFTTSSGVRTFTDEVNDCDESSSLVGDGFTLDILLDLTVVCDGGSATTATCTTSTAECVETFEEIGSATIFADLVNNDNVPLDECFVLTAEAINDPKPTTELSQCGCDTGDCDHAIRLKVTKLDPEPTSNIGDCGFSGFTLEDTGSVNFGFSDGTNTNITTKECCEALGFFYDESVTPSPCLWNTGSFSQPDCSQYQLIAIQEPNLALFQKPDGLTTTVVDDPECCTRLGPEYTAVMTRAGEWNCIVNLEVREPCADLVFEFIRPEDGIASFIDSTGGPTIYVPSPECCASLGLTAQSTPLGIICREVSQGPGGGSLDPSGGGLSDGGSLTPSG